MGSGQGYVTPPRVIHPYQSDTTMAHQAIKEAGVGDLSQHMPSLVRSVPECKFFGVLMLIVLVDN
jgi:hypothetical protein